MIDVLKFILNSKKIKNIVYMYNRCFKFFFKLKKIKNILFIIN